MKNDNFWIFALIVCFFIGVLTDWNLPTKVLVIGCSIVVLMQVAFQVYKLLKKEKNHHATKG